MFNRVQPALGVRHPPEVPAYDIFCKNHFLIITENVKPAQTRFFATRHRCRSLPSDPAAPARPELWQSSGAKGGNGHARAFWQPATDQRCRL